jgi:hypothetical protein
VNHVRINARRSLRGTWFATLVDEHHESRGLVEGATKAEATSIATGLAKELGFEVRS